MMIIDSARFCIAKFAIPKLQCVAAPTYDLDSSRVPRHSAGTTQLVIIAENDAHLTIFSEESSLQWYSHFEFQSATIADQLLTSSEVVDDPVGTLRESGSRYRR